MLQKLFPLCLLVYLSTSITPLCAQSYQETRYTIEDGLASNETFSVVQGKQGYIWVATDKGISKYDGHEFKTFGVAEGLQSTVIFKLIPSPLGGIVFSGADNKIGFIKNDSVSYLTIDGTLHVRSINIIDNQSFVVYYKSPKYEIYSWTGEKLREESLTNELQIIELGDSCIIELGRKDSSSSSLVRQNGERFLLERLQHEIKGETSAIKKGKTSVIINNSMLFFVASNNLFKKIPLDGQHTSDGLLIDSKERLWVGLRGKGVKVYSMTEKKLLFTPLHNYSISSVYEDIEGNFWITTLQHGIINLKPTNYQAIISGKITKLSYLNGKIVAILNDSSMFFYDFKPVTFKKITIGNEIVDIQPIENNLFLSLKQNITNPRVKRTLNDHSVQVFDTASAKLGSYKNKPIAIMYNYFSSRGTDSSIEKKTVRIESGYTYFIETISDAIYTGRPLGLYRLKKNGKNYVSHKLLPLPVTCMRSYKDKIILGTKGYGLLVSNEEFLIEHQYTTANGLSGNFISTLKRTGDTLICGTENGVSILSNILDSNLLRVTSNTQSDGLWSSNVTGVVLNDKDLFIGTDQGIQKIALSSFDKSRRNPVPIIEYINNKQLFSDSSIVIESGTKRITIGLNTIFFYEDKSFTQEYRLLGRDSNWVSTSSSRVEFLDLPPGTYEIQYRTKLKNNKAYSLTGLQFEILPLFTQTFIFKLLVTALSLLIILVLIKLRDKRLKEKTQLLLSQEQLRYRTLTAQLNPHFIFNALGSIQSLIITKKNELAEEYLASFSSLLDRTLQNTHHLFIPLMDEMAFIDEYITVEKSRFEKPFEFNWQISKEIDTQKTLVPTMFLQPYIENSIIHGINPLKTVGKIKVSIRKLKEDVLEIRVVDNGIGISAASKTRSKRRTNSLAMNNIQERIQAMEKLYKDTFHQKIREIFHADGSTKGTEVILNIPYQTKQKE
jgi:ligand-binding sensor domain-containing protein/two-component sensor histidine kinase